MTSIGYFMKNDRKKKHTHTDNIGTVLAVNGITFRCILSFFFHAYIKIAWKKKEEDFSFKHMYAIH